MKNFLDLQAIDTDLSVSIRLDPITDNGAPIVAVKINNLFFDFAEITKTTLINVNVGLTNILDIEISLKDKIYSINRETAVIVSISVDNIDVVPKYNHYVVYNNDHNYSSPTNYIGFNGIWTLKIEKPFYQWLHNISDQGWLLTPH